MPDLQQAFTSLHGVLWSLLARCPCPWSGEGPAQSRLYRALPSRSGNPLRREVPQPLLHPLLILTTFPSIPVGPHLFCPTAHVSEVPSSNLSATFSQVLGGCCRAPQSPPSSRLNKTHPAPDHLGGPLIPTGHQHLDCPETWTPVFL